MRTYTLKRKQFLPITLHEAWMFFSSPGNLATITPSYMDFRIIDAVRDTPMYAGQIIRYKVSVLPFVRMTWVTEISHVREPHYFVDKQLFGPYKWWHHEHFFEEVDGGVEMRDEVSYALPLGVLGQFAHALFVHRQLNSIFDYRFKILADIFKDKRILKSA